MVRTTPDTNPAACRTARATPPSAHFGRLGSWERVARIGGGAMYDVFATRAAGRSPDQPPGYALKLLRDEWQSDERGVTLLRRELQVSRRVNHPRLVPVLAAEVNSPPFYLVMPLLDGCSLADQLQQNRALDLPLLFWIARQAAEAIVALEAAGWMHGDIKPSNLIVSPAGHVTVIDLGFATRTSQPALIVDRPLLGTLNYMAPELLYSSAGGSVQSDVYSLGVTLFELLAGRLPFDANDVGELASQHRQAVPADLRHHEPRIPLRAARLVQQMLAKEPLRRPTPHEVVERLVSLEIETFAERFACEAA
jgi:serine/threonine-protein kinase